MKISSSVLGSALALSLGTFLLPSLASANMTTMGPRWLVEYSDDGTPSKIDDLTFPDWQLTYQIGHLEDDQSQSSRGSNGFLTVLRYRIMSPALDRDPRIDKTGLADLRNMTQTPEFREKAHATLPRNWWKQVKWKNRAMNESDTPPKNFTLSQIGATIEPEDPSLKEVWDSLEFVQSSVAGYDILWKPSASSRDTVSTPAKLLVDFQRNDFGFKEALTWDGISYALGGLADLIPEPLTQAIIKTALNRFFHFHKLVFRSHQAMLIEYLLSDASSQWLTQDQRTQAIESLVYSDSTLLTSWQWFWNTPASIWAKELSDQQGFADQARQWLQDNDPDAAFVTDNYVLGSSGGSDEHWLSAGQAPDDDSGPLAMLDFRDTNAVFFNRLSIEALSTAVAFATNFVPVVGGAVDGLYEYIVEKKEDDHRVWEARLTSYLESQATPDQTWSKEIEQLSAQKINPLLPSHDEAMRLAAARKAQLSSSLPPAP